jgi:hypothetical protein
MTEGVRKIERWVKIRHRASLAGQVVEHPTGRPLSGALVEIIEAPDAFTQWLALRALQFSGRWPVLYEHPERPWIARDGLFYILDFHTPDLTDEQKKTKRRYSYCTRTTRDGFFYFLNLPDGEYTLNVSLPGAGSRYGTVKRTVTVPQDGDSIQPPMIEINLPATTIKGQITNKSGAEVAGAHVRLVGSGEQTFSNVQGYFKLVGIEISKDSEERECFRTLQISAPKYQPHDEKVKLEIAGEERRLDLKLELISR